MKKTSAKTVARYGVLLSAALILSWIESVLPFRIPIPGVKLGLSNLCVTWILYEASLPATLAFGIVKSLLTSLLFGSLSGFLYSLAGIVLSVCVMALLKKCHLFSVFGVSMAGAAFHGLGQLAVATVLLRVNLAVLLGPMTAAEVLCGVLSALPLHLLARRNFTLFSGPVPSDK